jgi:hypothetical protein
MKLITNTGEKSQNFFFNDVTGKWETVMPATAENQETLIANTSALAMTIDDALTATAFNLNASAYEDTLIASADFTIDSILLNFTTAETRTITIYINDRLLLGGSVDTSSDNELYNNTDLSFSVVEALHDYGVNTGDAIKITATQTDGDCLMDLILKIKKGAGGLVPNPTLGAGNSIIGKVKPVDDNGDPITDNGSLVNKRWEDLEVENGNFYRAYIYSTVTAGVPKYCQFKTGNKITHLYEKEFIDGNDTFLCTLLEAPTLTDSVTVVPIVNANRNSENTSVNQLLANPTGVSGGATVDVDYIPATNQSPSKPTSSKSKIIMLPNTDYVYKLENLGSGDANFLGKLYWIEK